MSRAEVEDMTPRETDALVDALREKWRRESGQFALVAWAQMAANGARKQDGGRFSVADFMPRPPQSEGDRMALGRAQLEVQAIRDAAKTKYQKTNYEDDFNG